VSKSVTVEVNAVEVQLIEASEYITVQLGGVLTIEEELLSCGSGPGA